MKITEDFQGRAPTPAVQISDDWINRQVNVAASGDKDIFALLEEQKIPGPRLQVTIVVFIEELNARNLVAFGGVEEKLRRMRMSGDSQQSHILGVNDSVVRRPIRGNDALKKRLHLFGTSERKKMGRADGDFSAAEYNWDFVAIEIPQITVKTVETAHQFLPGAALIDSVEVIGDDNIGKPVGFDGVFEHSRRVDPIGIGTVDMNNPTTDLLSQKPAGGKKPYCHC